MIEPSSPSLVTVVVATHDRPRDAWSAIRSPLTEAMEDVEAVVVDDVLDRRALRPLPISSGTLAEPSMS